MKNKTFKRNIAEYSPHKTQHPGLLQNKMRRSRYLEMTKVDMEKCKLLRYLLKHYLWAKILPPEMLNMLLWLFVLFVSPGCFEHTFLFLFVNNYHFSIILSFFTGRRLICNLAGGFYSDDVGLVSTSCKRCPNGSFVTLNKAPGKQAQDCKTCPLGKWAIGWFSVKTRYEPGFFC